MARILVVDDEKSMVEFLSLMLTKEGYEVHVVTNGKEALERLGRAPFDLVVADLKMPKISGLEVLAKAREIDPEIAVIMITAYGTIESAIEAMKQGAYDYITKPFKIEEVKVVIKKALEQKRLLKENKLLRLQLTERFKLDGEDNIIGKSPKMQEVFDLVKKIAPTNSTVLIYGESGTGKELIAKAVHYHSYRKNGPFVTINCAAIPEQLLESELFGHERGSFTGAITSKEGLFEVADGGTLFLDEVGETSPAIQVKLLRVLEEQEFKRVGGTKEIKVNIRLIASTNKDLKEAVARGTFREDLYYRLNVIPLYLPPLRERKEDIPLLAKHFLQKYSQENNRTIRKISPEAMSLLLKYDWPGNVRELEHVIERAVTLETNEVVELKDLPESIQNAAQGEALVRRDVPLGELSFKGIINKVERELVLEALRKVQGSRTKAAQVLGLTLRSLRYLISKHKIPRNYPEAKEERRRLRY